jgi:hypothetical protein
MSEFAQRYVEELLGHNPERHSHTVRIPDIAEVGEAIAAKGWHIEHLREDVYRLTRLTQPPELS